MFKELYSYIKTLFTPPCRHEWKMQSSSLGVIWMCMMCDKYTTSNPISGSHGDR